MPTKTYHVTPDNAQGEPLVLFTGAVQGTTADWEPVTLVNSDGSLAETNGMRVAVVDTTYFTAGSATATTSGNTAIYTPTAGKAIRLYYIAYSADASVTTQVVASIRFGAAASCATRWL